MNVIRSQSKKGCEWVTTPSSFEPRTCSIRF